MGLILLDGPEKAGKTTIATELARRLDGEIIHHGPCKDDREYKDHLQYSVTAGHPVIWDRGWPSEHVYSEMLGRGRRLGADPWLGEWLYGRAFQTLGVRAIIAGPHPTELEALRSPEDLDVDPTTEQKLFVEYGRRFGYKVIHNQHAPGEIDRVCDMLIREAKAPRATWVPRPPNWVGPTEAPVVVLFGIDPTLMRGPDAWLPGTTSQPTKFARLFGDKALEFGWTSTFTCPPAVLRTRQLVIPVGRIAALWAGNNLPEVNIYPVPNLARLTGLNRGGGQEERLRVVLMVTENIHEHGRTQ